MSGPPFGESNQPLNEAIHARVVQTTIERARRFEIERSRRATTIAGVFGGVAVLLLVVFVIGGL